VLSIKTEYRRQRMRHRLIALLLATVVGATPLARELCSASCAEHHDASTSAAHAHHLSSDATAQRVTHGHEVPAHQATGHGTPGHEMRGDGVAFSGAPHAAAMACCDSAKSIGQQTCAHGTDGQTAAASATTSLVDTPAVVAAVVAPPGIFDPTISLTSIHPISRTPVPLSLRTPLRV
jgi:hypothetical protein